MTRTAKKSGLSSLRLASVAVAACFAAPAWSLPTAPTVVVPGGTATFAQAGNVLTITNSDKAIINWQQFNIAAGEMVKFVQAASSSVLNRVLAGGGRSDIHGALQSDGRVWLVNPAGILIGHGATIDTAAFVASTLALRDQDFLAGKLTFTGPGGNVINQGRIVTPSGGSVYLIGSNVSNEGIITTPQGETILAAGQTVDLIDTATPGVKVTITGAAGNTTNLGTVVAEAGRIGMAGVIVRNSGTLNASSVVAEGGKVFLRASQDTYVDGNGRIVATGTKGGSVEVLGNRVAVMDNARIDASGTNGGGTILVGGDYQGKNPDVQNAQVTYFGANATLKANAIDNGDGGKVIVWADDTTRAYGSIEAKGGANGGNGGFVETSGHRYLDFKAHVDTSAPRGNEGMLLLDPANILITDTGSEDYIVNTGGYGGAVFQPALDNVDSVLLWSSIAGQSSSVTVSTASYGGNITFYQTTGAWHYNNSNTLTFNAVALGGSPGHINLSGNGASTTIINDATSGGDITFQASGQIFGNWWTGPNTAPSGGLNIKTPGSISFSSAYFSGGIGNTGVTLGNGTIESTGGGNIIINASNSSVGIGLLKTTTGSVTINAGYSIWDDNWTTPGAINIQTSGSVSLVSQYGGDPYSYCWDGPCSAISADIAGSPNSLSVEVQGLGGSTYGGGISIRTVGTPTNIYLADNSTHTDPWRNWVEYETTGNLTIAGDGPAIFIGKNVWLHAGGDLNYTGLDIYSPWGSINELSLTALGNLNVLDSLPTTDVGTYLVAGNTLTISGAGTIFSSGDVWLGAGSTLNLAADSGVVAEGSVFLGAGVISKSFESIDSPDQIASLFGANGVMNIDGSITGMNYYGDYGTDLPGIVFITGDLNMTGGQMISPYGTVAGVVGGNLLMNNGASIISGYDTSLLMLGADSTIYLNETATSGAPSRIISDYSSPPGTTYVVFLARSGGGIVIDGVQTTTSSAGGSGFFSGSDFNPATLGNDLFILYSSMFDICTASPEVCAPPPLPVPPDPCALNPSSCALGEKSLSKIPEDESIGGEEDEFGGSPSRPGRSGKKRVTQCRA